MDFNGLSVDQAPPISAPVRFFLTAPLFAILGGVLILLSDGSVLASRYATETIAITHAFTIGFFSFVMFGALLQMLPVLAGIKIPKVAPISKTVYLLMLFGALCMIFGLWMNISQIILTASLLLGTGFITLIVSMLFAFKKVVHVTASIRAIITALFFALFITLLGMHLLASYATGAFSALHAAFANVHSVWAVFGFTGILIVGVTLHVLPMFYVAPKLNYFSRKNVFSLLAAGLFLWLILQINSEEYATAAKIWIGLFFGAFAITVHLKLNARRRKVSDITIWYWRSAVIFMMFGVLLWVVNDFLNEKYIVIVALMIGGGFIFSVMIGMLYKIVPFLVWFHLNAKGYMSIPTVNDMIHKKLSLVQFLLFLISLAGFILSFFAPYLLHFFALIFIASMAILEYNIVMPILIYKKVMKTKPDFDMSMFTAKVEK